MGRDPSAALSDSARGVSYALIAALLFGASTPFAKMLLRATAPVTLAGLLYGGSGVGLSVWIALRAAWRPRRQRAGGWRAAELAWLGLAILAGGVIAPVLLMSGLRQIPAANASLLLNLEAVFTALLAWCVFRENVDRRILLGMVAIVLGGALLAWPAQLQLRGGALWIAAACACWAIDNNLTRKVSSGDPLQIAALKGLSAGAVNLGLAAHLGLGWPAPALIGGAALLGFAGYGVSLTLFVLALRSLGTARTGAYFATAPFIGAVLSLLVFRRLPTPALALAALLMGLGVWLHLTEHHDHEHAHPHERHTHSHRHDAHHQHEHEFEWDGQEPHDHEHVHEPLTHSHPHYPDIHHRHGH
ncbi:MAG: EamA family transporter [Gammaproteobacteria bacterium]|nr:EamA family transporter [Gammaproteobacteria bacterium]